MAAAALLKQKGFTGTKPHKEASPLVSQSATFLSATDADRREASTARESSNSSDNDDEYGGLPGDSGADTAGLVGEGLSRGIALPAGDSEAEKEGASDDARERRKEAAAATAGGGAGGKLAKSKSGSGLLVKLFSVKKKKKKEAEDRGKSGASETAPSSAAQGAAAPRRCYSATAVDASRAADLGAQRRPLPVPLPRVEPAMALYLYGLGRSAVRIELPAAGSSLASIEDAMRSQAPGATAGSGGFVIHKGAISALPFPPGSRSLQDIGVRNGDSLVFVDSARGGSVLRFMEFADGRLVRDAGGLVALLQPLRAASPDEHDFIAQSHDEWLRLARSGCPALRRNDAAGMLAVLAWTSNLLYREVNRSLADGTHAAWRPFLNALMRGLRQLPYWKGTAYRGIRDFELTAEYAPGSLVMWPMVSGLSQDPQQARSFSNERGVLFEVDALTARDVSPLSFYPDEREVLLLPYSHMRVVSVDRAQSPVVVRLREVPVPRTTRVVFWVDDHPENNLELFRTIETASESDDDGGDCRPVSIVCCATTAEALAMLNTFHWLSCLGQSAGTSIRVVSDMERVEEGGVVRPTAGVELVAAMRRDRRFPDPVLFYVSDARKAREALRAAGLDDNVSVTDSERGVLDFVDVPPGDADRAPVGRLRCAKGHALLPHRSVSTLALSSPGAGYERGFLCNACGAGPRAPSDAAPVLHCAECQYDVCPDCAAKCPAGHVLSEAPALALWAEDASYAAGFVCDLCKSHVRSSASAVHCPACKYDVCTACFFASSDNARLNAPAPEEVRVEAAAPVVGGAADRSRELPPGWARGPDPSGAGGELFTYTPTGQTQRGAPAGSPLQAGWSEQRNAEGNAVYENAATGARRAERPPCAVAAPPCAPSVPLLPSGWLEQEDRATGRRFFVNVGTGESRWLPPQGTPSVTASLPQGWVEGRDGATGQPFFINARTGDRQWELPGQCSSAKTAKQERDEDWF
eukprot:m51a1_g2823 putative ubiquitin family protein (979) ;mRNA; f:185826-189288